VRRVSRFALPALILAAGVIWWSQDDDAGETGVEAPPGPVTVAPAIDEEEPLSPGEIQADSPAGDAPPGPPAEADVPVYFITSEADALRILEEHGLSREVLARWAFEKGMDPAGFGLTFGGQEAYALYDDETLSALAGQGDAWAQQTLADRIWQERPLEGADLYREAAMRGSAHAAEQLANLYLWAHEALERGRTADWSPDTIEALRQAGAADGGLKVAGMAWALAGEADAGLPQGTFASFMLSDYTDRDIQAACERAAGIVADLGEQRRRLGIETGWPGPAPLVPDSDELTAVGCPPEILPGPDVADCEPVRFAMDRQRPGDLDGITVRICPDRR
jgi:hypothetical protein